MVMEALGSLMVKTVSGGFIHGFDVGRDRNFVVSVSHLLFANDT